MRQRVIPSVGDRIGRYEIIRELGAGGFGVVFLAHQAGLDAEVAIKLLTLQTGEDAERLQAVDRFRQEAQIIKRLQHPCALKVRDIGETDDGIPYLVTEYISGDDLDKVIKQQPLTVARTIRIGTQILGCLAEAHALGVIHRDLKPGNIKVCDIIGEEDAVKVLDFGIAKLSDDAGGLETKTGSAFGTPLYMAPELCRGEKGVDGRADLYSLGLILAECMTGVPIVQADSTFSALYFQSSPDPHVFPPELRNTAIFPVLEQATHKDRDARFPDALSMRQALQSIPTGGAEMHQLIVPPPSMTGEQPTQTNPAPMSEGFAVQQTMHAPTQPVSGPLPSEPAIDQTAQTGSGGRPIFILVLILLLCGAVAGGIWFVMQPGSDDPASTPVAAPATPIGEPTDDNAPTIDPGFEEPPATPPGTQPHDGTTPEDGQLDPGQVAAIEPPTITDPETDAPLPELLVQATGSMEDLRRVRVIIESTPEGAVIRDSDGNVLARTPFDGYIVSTHVEVDLNIDSEGYRSTLIQVDFVTDELQHFTEVLRERRRDRPEPAVTTELTEQPLVPAEPLEPTEPVDETGASPFGRTEEIEPLAPEVNPFGATERY